MKNVNKHRSNANTFNTRVDVDMFVDAYRRHTRNSMHFLRIALLIHDVYRCINREINVHFVICADYSCCVGLLFMKVINLECLIKKK